MPAATSSPSSLADRTRRRVDRRLMPFIFLLYTVSYLDRVNVSSAGLQMTHDLGFSDAVFGFGAGVFFMLAIAFLEIPGGILAEVWSARKWIARILISWGFVASLTGLIHTAQQFYWIRFSLGVAEAGFVPGILVYLSHWYRPEDRGKAIAMFCVECPRLKFWADRWPLCSCGFTGWVCRAGAGCCCSKVSRPPCSGS